MCTLLGGFDSKRRVNEDERGCTWDGPGLVSSLPTFGPRHLWSPCAAGCKYRRLGAFSFQKAMHSERHSLPSWWPS